MHYDKSILKERLAKQADPQETQALFKHLSTRTVAELKYIMQRKRGYFKILRDHHYLPMTATDVEIEIAAFLLAVADIKASKPNAAELVAQIRDERKARRDGAPDPKTLKGKIYKDFDDIDEARREGATWEDIRRALKKHRRYKGEALDLATISHTYLKIKRAREMKETPAI